MRPKGKRFVPWLAASRSATAGTGYGSAGWGAALGWGLIPPGLAVWPGLAGHTVAPLLRLSPCR
jgi:hypothetical protein